MFKEMRASDWISALTNLGVLVGLILVAYEVRHATIQAEAAATNEFSGGYVTRMRELALSAELSEIYVKANADGVESLSPVEHFRISTWERATKTRLATQLIQYRLGVLDRGAIRAMLPVIEELENGIWAELGISPIRGFEAELDPIREEIRNRGRSLPLISKCGPRAHDNCPLLAESSRSEISDFKNLSVRYTPEAATQVLISSLT